MDNENELNELNPPVMDGYKKIPTFKLWVANRFPYMETDFDALTNYELLTALVDYLNNVIKNEENVESNVSKLNQAYLELLNYVKDYFKNLDVQEEINNKLDDLVEDGTLTRLIGAYIQPLIDEQNQEISNFKTQVNGQIALQNAQIQAVESGSPLVASSVSGMTDTSRVYVNTTDGNWYYYNGSAWTIGGVYQASEDSNSVKKLQQQITGIAIDTQYLAKTNNFKKFAIDYTDFEVGSIQGGTGQNSNGNHALRSKGYIKFSSNVIFYMLANYPYNFRIFRYNASDYSFVDYMDYNNNDNPARNIKTIIFNDNYVYRFLYYDANHTVDFSSYDVRELSQLIPFYYESDYIYDNIPYSQIPSNYGFKEFLSLKNYKWLTYKTINPSGEVSGSATGKSIVYDDYIYGINGLAYNLSQGYSLRIAKYLLSNYSFDSLVNLTDNIGTYKFDNNYCYKIQILYTDVINKEEALKLNKFANSDNIIKKKTNFNYGIKSFAHQGGLFDSIPQNTLNAYKNSINYGFNGIEGDIRFTSDNVAVISHDDVRRTTSNVDITISNVTYSELMTYQFYDDNTLFIPTLLQTLNLCRLYNLIPELDLKTYLTETTYNSIMNDIKKAGMINRVIFRSSIDQPLIYINERLDNQVFVYSFHNKTLPTINDLENSTDFLYVFLRNVLQKNNIYLSFDDTDLSNNEELILNIKALGYKTDILSYTNNPSYLANYIKLSDMITSNYYSIDNVNEYITDLTVF